MYGDSHAPRLLYRSKKENPEEQALDDEELVETEVATDPIETEHGTVSLVPEAQEENPNLENHEGWEQIEILEEESIPQSKVPIANSEILKSIELGKVDLGLEKLEHVVLNENLEQEWDQMNVKEKLEVDGDVERGQKMISDTETGCAHKVFVKMPSKEKSMKHLKAWKFKFKPTSKRSRLMGDKVSFVDATVLLNKDPKETIWDCVKKEFKETMAACGKKRVDRFRLVEEKESRLEVLDLNQTFMYHQIGHHQIGHGVDILLVIKMVVHNKEMDVVLQRATSLMICDCSDRSSRANRVWKPGGLLCVQDHSGGSNLMRTQRFHGLRLQRIIYMDMKFQEVIVDNVETGSKEHSHESFGAKGLAYDGCVILGMNFAGFERGEAELLATSRKVQRIDLFSFCCSCTNQILVAIYTEIEENLEFKQLLAAVERFSREVIEELAKRIVIEQKIEGGLICGDVKFHLKHKWRFRLLKSFSRLVLLAWINLWFSKAYEFSGQLQDSSKGEAESFPFLDFAAGQHLLWMQNNCEPIFIVSELKRKKKLCYKTWMFKYKVGEEDQGILQSRTENSLSRREISTFIYQAEALLFESKEPTVSATQEPAIFQSANAHGMITRGKDGIVKTNLRYSLLDVQRNWEKGTHDVDITDAYHVLQEEFEQVENHTPCSVVKLERPQDHDALLLPFPGDERFQIKHKWRFKLLLSILELELYLESLVLITSYAHQFDIISLIILMRVELSVFFSTKPDGFFFSTNLEVKVSLKGEDVIQDERKRRGHVWHVRKKQIVGHVGEADWPEKKKGDRLELSYKGE